MLTHLWVCVVNGYKGHLPLPLVFLFDLSCRMRLALLYVSLYCYLRCCSELDLHPIRLGSQGDPIDWFVVWFSSILGPDELELPQQCHHDKEQLHSSQTLSKTHTGA